MKIDRLASMIGVDWTEYGCYDKFIDKMKTKSNTEYYVYREGYVLDKSGKIKEPSIYIFNKYFTKIKGTGHSEFGARTYDDEYEIFLTKESALEYANIKQKQFLHRKEQDEIKKLKKN